MKIEVVSAVPHATIHQAVLSRRNRSIFCAGPYEVLPLENCFEPLPSTSSLADCAVECLELSTDERSIGVATNALLKIADVQTGREVRNLSGHTLPINSLAASKFSVYSWYTGSSDFSWAQWDTRMHPSKVLGARTSGIVRSVAVSPGDRFVAVGTDHSIQLFDARQREYIKQFACSGHRLEFNPTEVLLSAVGHDRVVRFFCLENLEMISQSDPFLDDIQASAFDSHLMIASTSDSINLLTWEPCDILATVPLKTVEKVVNVGVNGGVELDFICIGETTERVEMRTYSIEELLSYSPSQDLSGSIYEEEDEIDAANDVSPIDEMKNIILEPDIQAETSESSVQSDSASSNSNHSSPASPERPVIKTRSATASLKAGKPSTRSLTPVLSKPPSLKSQPATHPRTNGTTQSRGMRGAKQSPSLGDFRGSTQSLQSRTDIKKRSASAQRDSETITITYLGRPRTPSEGEHIARASSTLPRKPTTLDGARPKVAVSKRGSPVKKATNDVREKPSAQRDIMNCLKAALGICKQQEKDTRSLLKVIQKRGSNALVCAEVKNDDRLSIAALRLINEKNDWSLNMCNSYLPTIIDGLVSSDDERRAVCLKSLDVISDEMPAKLVKFANSNSRIGVDVAAEERAEKANNCLKMLRDICKKRDWYYKQLSKEDVIKLDAILERVKVL
ncbi:unnamed protein product [Caenorhabditis bovis]|uniref:Katanin p80 subunit C-terminal domain-containing protein n=1 Tax=Caenorhabditis bovis TaxID=2654633 RepID=A0A8S1F7Q0_9PELO|nr:unnamed protein product [Caenorhabditis bovis]